jgi:hypothetical protein
MAIYFLRRVVKIVLGSRYARCRSIVGPPGPRCGHLVHIFCRSVISAPLPEVALLQPRRAAGGKARAVVEQLVLEVEDYGGVVSPNSKSVNKKDRERASLRICPQASVQGWRRNERQRRRLFGYAQVFGMDDGWTICGARDWPNTDFLSFAILAPPEVPTPAETPLDAYF